MTLTIKRIQSSESMPTRSLTISSSQIKNYLSLSWSEPQNPMETSDGKGKPCQHSKLRGNCKVCAYLNTYWRKSL